MKSNILQIFTDYRQFQIFILGIFSAMPLIIIYSTLSAWLTLFGIDIAIITSLAAARVFYSLKFFWAPFVDRVKLPIIHKIGQRKSWMSLISLVLGLIIFLYSRFDPKENISTIYITTIFLGLFSATFDIVIDAFRIDSIEKEKQSIAAANAVFGYRVGVLIAGAMGLHIAGQYGFNTLFSYIAFSYICLIAFIAFLKEPYVKRENFDPLTSRSWKLMTIDPFIDFFKKDKSVIILLAIIFYKLGDAMLGVVAMPFYLKLGFSTSEIGLIAKGVGFWATITGLYVGGIIMYRYGHFKGLLICGFMQSITNLSFIWLNHMGHNNMALAVAISIENIAAGMGDAALVGYLSYLCNKQFSATQYALFSSASGLFSHTIVAFGGAIVKKIGWDLYFGMTILLGLPALLLIMYLQKHISTKPDMEEEQI